MMNEPHDPNITADFPQPSSGALDAGMAAAYGAPRSTLGDLRPVLLQEAKGDSADIIKPNSDAMPPPEQTGDRYQLHGEIARGGMGAVLRGRDVDLGRDLAVKVLLEKHAHRPEVARRFIEEAQIGGQLQHPGVVPVYDIGRFGRRPFFTMKLVKGQTLAALLADRTGTAADRPRLLGIALQVAQTVSYAHAKGVIHRDLKPANVMVGAFGEVQVMDWGLAKVLAEGGIADEERTASRERERPEDVTTIRTARSSGSGFGTDTEAGSLLGTPAYMPPEQANGDIANLDRRADVFGLSAILCEILTGQAPYVGRSAEEVRRKACNGDLADAMSRLDACGADAELISLTKACLAAEPIDRPKDAQAVADALTAYLDGVQDKLHKAELAKAEAKAKAIEEVKRRRLTLALAATILVAVMLGGGGWLWVKNERDARQIALTREVNDAMNKATSLREQAKTAPTGSAALFAQAREQASRALALIESADDDAGLAAQVRSLETQLNEEEKDRKLLAALDEAHLKQAETLSQNRFAEERAVPLFREAFRAYGMPVGEGDPKAIAERIRQRPAASREAIVAALDEWDRLASNPRLSLAEPHRDWLRAVLSATEPDDAWTRQVRDARAEKDKAKRRAALTALAASVDVEKVPVRALTHLAQLGALGREDALEPAEAVKLLRRAQARYPADFWLNHNLGRALQAITPPQHDEAVRFLTAAVALRPDSPGAHVNLGIALLDNGQRDEAVACFQKAIALDPKYAGAHANLGNALDRQGRVDEAIAAYQNAVKLDPTLPVVHLELGAALHRKGQLDEAIACYHQAIALEPKDAKAHSSLGEALRQKGQLDEAIACHQKAIALDPKFAGAHVNLGVALRHSGRLDEAIACYQKAIALDPKFAPAHNSLGIALEGKGQFDEAIACHQKAIAVDPKFAPAHNNLGAVLAGKGQLDEGIACFQRAIALDPKNAKYHGNLANALDHKGQVDDAITSYQRAIALDPHDAATHYNLGNALDTKGQLDEAIASYRKAIELMPNYAEAHCNLGFALFHKGQLDEAIACLRTAIALNPNLANAHNLLGLALKEKGQLDEAVASYQKAIELSPKFDEAYCNLGHAFRIQGRFAEALAAYQRGHELGTKRPGWRYPSAEWIRETELLTALEAKLPAFLKGEFQPKDTAERLGLAGVCQGKKLHATAARMFADAFAGDPTLADNLNSGHRSDAACSAALAAAGQGEDAAKLDVKEKARLRRQALDWLRADLAACMTLTENGPPNARRFVQQRLKGWQQDDDLASIRDKPALDKLPAEDRAACEKLWADVAALLKKAEAPAKEDN